MDKIFSVIIEDEIPALEEIKFLLKRHKEIEVIGEARDGKSGFDLVMTLNPKVVFLDINIPIFDGMELANQIRKVNKDIYIIFITALKQYALRAFEVDTLDYILKPIDENRFEIAIKRIIDAISIRENRDADLSNKINDLIKKIDKRDKAVNKISCEINGKIVFVNINEIMYGYVENEKTYLKTENTIFVTNHTLQDIEFKSNLIRTHRSYIVNLDQIKELYSWFNGTYRLVMEDGLEIPVSRGNVKKIKELMGI